MRGGNVVYVVTVDVYMAMQDVVLLLQFTSGNRVLLSML